MGLGDNTNTGYKPDWRYDMTGGGVKKKAEISNEPEVNTETKEVLTEGSTDEYWPYDMSGNRSKSKVAADTSPANSSRSAEAPWPYDMSGSLEKSRKNSALQEAAPEPVEAVEADEEKTQTRIEPARFTPAKSESSDDSYWPYDMSGGRSKSKTTACASPAPSKTDEETPWPYDMSDTLAKSRKKDEKEAPEIAQEEVVVEAPVGEESEEIAENKSETNIEPARFTPAQPKSDDNGYWPYDMSGGKGNSKSFENGYWPYDMSSGTSRSHKKDESAPVKKVIETENINAKEPVETIADVNEEAADTGSEKASGSKIEPARFTPAQPKASNNGYWPYDMSAGNKNNAAKDPNYWPYDMSSDSGSKNKAAVSDASDTEAKDVESSKSASEAEPAASLAANKGENNKDLKKAEVNASDKEPKKEKKVNNNHYESDGVGFLKWLRRKSNKDI